MSEPSGRQQDGRAVHVRERECFQEPYRSCIQPERARKMKQKGNAGTPIFRPASDAYLGDMAGYNKGLAACHFPDFPTRRPTRFCTVLHIGGSKISD
ncbi:hypothetical protein NDU88_003943 [Pleurodeles waltl]|uniref:Uncharacterized protein n=1 Tax=Pleurodeles waltl TaxID=8319 RepID=A0AAV7PEA1_PLEWA|nr:hypothetical protein NDU88_003943 [Pleurodeles waltl]